MIFNGVKPVRFGSEKFNSGSIFERSGKLIMFESGTFIKMIVIADIDSRIPVILCPAVEECYIFLPDHQKASDVSFGEFIDDEPLTGYMDGKSATLVANATNRALQLIMACGGVTA
ncbi:MAG: hypothetical protein PHF34_06565 [Bacteroidales bacterium]|jgi:hypothetical protein|nr:hypothetical protein [Bacteroidales bacterium]